MRKTFIKKLLCGTVLGGLAAGSLPAIAQDAEDDSDVIIVTGSRLNQANIEATSPVTTIDAELFDVRGTTDVIDLINILPQAVPAQTTAFANGANGTSTINLRGLGAIRTLVLLNGKRLPPGSPTLGGFAADVNLVPSQLVERVEIVTGGASAVYGSDAVGGVANFILRRDFEGFEIDGQFGFNQSNNGTDFAQNALLAVNEDPVDGSVTDNASFNITGILGAGFADGRGNATAYFSYLQNDGIQQGDRDFARCAFGPFGFSNDLSEDDIFCAGSNQGPFPTSFFLNPQSSGDQQIFDANGNELFATGLTDDEGNPFTDRMQATAPIFVGLIDAAGNPIGTSTPAVNAGNLFLADGTLIEAGDDGIALFDAAGNPISNPSAGGAFSLNSDDTLTAGFNNPFNFNPFNPVRRSVERFNAGFSSYYEIAEDVEAYIDFGFTQSNSPQIIAPSAAFGSSINQVNCDNPLLTAEQRALICGNASIDGPFPRDVDGDGFAQTEIRRRFVEGGPRTDDRTLTNFRVVGGFKGTIDDNFEWDVFGQFANTTLNRIQTNQVTLTNLEQSLDIIADEDGNPVCRVGPPCIPFTSAFQNGVPSDPGLPAFIDTPVLTQGAAQQTVFGATIKGDLSEYGLKSPWAEAGVSALVGVEYRRDQLQTQADGINAGGLLVGAGGPVLPTNGATELYEFFLETSIPLVAGAPLIEQLNLSGAYRRSEYSAVDILNGVTGGDFGTNTFAVGLSWVPVDDIRFRAQFQRAIRAPNTSELFAPVNTGLTNLTDPCAGDAPTATAAGCANSGLPTSQFGFVPPDSGQLNTQTGGNVDLIPESGDTFTVGVIYQPNQIEGLTISADYFNISVADIVGTIPTSQILNGCIDTGNPVFCDLIQRSAIDGSLTSDAGAGSFIVATNQNIAEFQTSGIDFQVGYSYDLGALGEVNWNYNSTYQLTSESTSFEGAAAFDCVGLFGDSCGGPTFGYRHTLSTTYQSPYNVRASVLWRYNSATTRATDLDTDTGEFTLATGGFASATDAESYIDVGLFWDVNENATLRFGVNNVFDNDPPLLLPFATTGNIEANTFAGVFDAGGRFIFVGANLRF